jgi:PPP family 3-phenylpropionic acid transporter
MPLSHRVRAASRLLGTEAARLRLVYFLYYASAGSLLPFLSRYLVGRGFTGQQIGTIQMVPSIVALFGGIVWARVAERLRDTVRVVGWITTWSACCALLLPFAGTPLAVGLVLLGMALGDRGLVPLLDSLTMGWVRAGEGRSYSRIRVFGSIGFAALAYLLGQVLTLRGDRPGDVAVPVTITTFAVGYALAARRLVPQPATHREHASGQDLRALLGDRRLLALLLACAVHWIACMPYSLWMGQFVDELHLPATVTGAGITAGVLAEVTVMTVFPWFERRFSSRALLATAFLGSALRWALLARTTSAHAVVALQLFHGLSYGLFWSTLVRQVTELVPVRMRATGLALTAAMVFGLANMVGSQLAGWGHDRTHSVARLFAFSAWTDLAIAAAVVALLAHRRMTRGSGTVAGASPQDPGEPPAPTAEV